MSGNSEISQTMHIFHSLSLAIGILRNYNNFTQKPQANREREREIEVVITQDIVDRLQLLPSQASEERTSFSLSQLAPPLPAAAACTKMELASPLVG